MRMLTILMLFALTTPVGAQVLTQVTTNGKSVGDVRPVLSNDGQTLAWLAGSVSGGFQPFAATAPYFVPRQLAVAQSPTTHVYSIAISGDGSTVAYIDDYNLWVVPAAGGQARQVTKISGGRVSSHGITLSEDGRLACFQSNDSQSKISDIQVVDTVTGRLTNITKHTVSELCTGCISGDGKTVAFTAYRGLTGQQAWVANVDGSGLRRLTNFASGRAFSPRLDHAGRICVFESKATGQYEVYSVHTDGTRLVNLSKNSATPDRRAWISADGDRVIWKSDRNGARDVFMAYPDGTQVRRVTTFNLLDPHAQGDSHVVSGDGTVVAFASIADWRGQNADNDHEIFLWRDGLTRLGQARPGSTITFLLADSTRAGAAYEMRCSLGRTPGIVIPGVGTVPLNPDDLFVLSGQAPALFRQFQGVVNPSGGAAGQIALPNIPALTGFAFYTSAVTVSGRAKIYNPVKVTIG